MPDPLYPEPQGRYASAPDVRAAKAALRSTVRSARRKPEAAAAAARRTASALELCLRHEVVALYCSVGDEPDTWPLIRELADAGRTVLLPVLGRRPDGTVRRDPDWAFYQGRDALRLGFAGIPEPVGDSLGTDGLRRASLVWCSALAATPRGDRLGSGGGWYDRALTHASGEAVRGVLWRDDEVLDHVPVEPFDRRIAVIVTDRRTIRATAGPE